jgi:hypothetical protein
MLKEDYIPLKEEHFKANKINAIEVYLPEG